MVIYTNNLSYSQSVKWAMMGIVKKGMYTEEWEIKLNIMTKKIKFYSISE
jgi:hypothetical protein